MNTLNQTNQQIIQLLAAGKTVKEVAAVLAMKQRTVTDRIQEMKIRFRCANATQLVVTLLSLNLAGSVSDL